MNKMILLIVMLMSVVIPMCGLSSKKAFSAIDHKNIHRYKAWDSPAPNFKVKDFDGNKISNKDFKGKWICLYFWSTKGNWGLKGLKEIEQAAQKHNDEMVIICIACYDSKGDWKAVVENIKRIPNLRHVLINKTDRVFKDFHISIFPTLILINPEGNILDTHIGLLDAEYLIYINSLIL